jgi:hypothetical protein
VRVETASIEPVQFSAPGPDDGHTCGLEEELELDELLETVLELELDEILELDEKLELELSSTELELLELSIGAVAIARHLSSRATVSRSL